MRISDWSSDVCSSDLRRREDAEIEAANDNQKQDENAADTAQRADPIAPVDPRPGWSDLGPAVSHYGDRGYVAQNTDKTGNNARNEELSNIGFGQDAVDNQDDAGRDENRSEEHTSELQSLMRITYAVFCLK